MTTVGFIGSGYTGSTVARLAIEAGRNEKGQPVGEDAIRAALATATR
ncbi:hypothetical protein [Streptomyces sp. NPDC058683]